MVVEYIRYRIAPERAAGFIEAYQQASASLADSPSCLGYELARCSEDAEQFILRILWQSIDAHLKVFRASPQFQTFFRAIQPYVADIQEMRHYERTAVQWTRP
ncbi:MAG: putative quinol monooxygenase [Polyangia bacterium]